MARQVNDVLQRSTADTGRAAAQLRSVAAECRRRAGVAGSVALSWDSYDADYSKYEARLVEFNDGVTDVEPVAPQAPDAGPGWVEF